ncbi:MAG: hypothetical protein R2788_11580 [Saprospiraceae bacterium]
MLLIAALAIFTRSLPKDIFAQLHYLLLLYGTAQILAAWDT